MSSILSTANRFFYRWRIGIFIPLLFLLVDFWQYPGLKHSQMVANSVTSRDVASQAAVYIGRLKGHRILVSSDDIYDRQSFEDLQGKNVGLIIPHYLTKIGIATQSGSLGRGVLARLAQLGSHQKEKFDSFLRNATSGSVAGQIREYALENEKGVSSLLPFSHIYVVLLGAEDPPETHLANVTKALKDIMVKSKQKGQTALIVPCLTIDPRYRNSIEPKKFFTSVFTEAPLDAQPPTLRLSLYSRWKTAFQSKVLNALSTAWQDQFNTMPSTVQTLYYPRPRSTLLILSLCLGVCSIFIPLSFRNTIIIISGFLLIVITAVAVMAMQFGHYSRDLLFVATLVVLIGAAVFFPFLGHWNPKDIFDKHMEGISDA
jgi:hypothetical protein